MLTPSERTLRAQIAANTRWSTPGQREAQSTGQRERIKDRFRNSIDPERKLQPQELERLAEAALRAHMARLALKASKARRRRKEAA